MINIKSEWQIERMRAAGALLHKVLETLKNAIEPGVTTLRLDQMAEELIRDGGGIPSFKGYNGFPYTICASVDEQVVHGFSSDTPLRQGQLLSIDCGCILDGWQSDSAFTILVGGGSVRAQKLIDDTERCFWLAADKARSGNHLGDIGNAVEQYARKRGYGVIRELCGHGIGERMHEAPNVPNFGRPGSGPLLKPGMTIAVEPMISLGTWKIRTLSDGWTAVTADGSLAAHYEHTLCITEGEPEILSWPGKRVSEVLR